MRIEIASLAALSLLALTSGAVRAQTPPAPAPTAPAPGDPAAVPPPSSPTQPRPADPTAPPSAIARPAPAAAPSGGASDRAHIDAAVTFLKALAHTSHKGDQAAQAWTDLKDVSADKVSITVAGAHHDLDVAGKSWDSRLLNFSKIASLREGKDIQGVSVGQLDIKSGADEHKGAGKIHMTQTDGKWTVQSIEVE